MWVPLFIYTTLTILLISLLLYQLCINFRIISNVHIFMRWGGDKETWIDKFDASLTRDVDFNISFD